MKAHHGSFPSEQISSCQDGMSFGKLLDDRDMIRTARFTFTTVIAGSRLFPGHHPYPRSPMRLAEFGILLAGFRLHSPDLLPIAIAEILRDVHFLRTGQTLSTKSAIAVGFFPFLEGVLKGSPGRR